METSLPARDYTRRRGELSTFGRALSAANRIKFALTAVAFFTILAMIAAFFLPGAIATVIATVIGVIVVGVGATFLWHLISVHLIEPDLATRKWLQQICDGEFDSNIELAEDHPHFKELNFHTRNVGSSLLQLSDEMESLVVGQTQRLESQNQVLALLFQLTSDVAHDIDQQSVLEKVCLSLSDWLGDVPVGVYLEDKDQYKLQTSVSDFKYSALCQENDLVSEVKAIEGVVKLPIYRGEDLIGMVHVIGNDADSVQSKESMRVFNAVSKQLGMFIVKNNAVESVQQARVIEERVRLGAEIHDSLAQTLLASKYQLRMLRETLESNPSASVLKEIQRIENTIDEANVEVRDLIGQTRLPSDDQQYVDSISSTIEEFNSTHSIPVFYQNDNPQLQFTVREASVIQRIVRESLVNANKYSQANNIRVYLRVEHSGVRSLLIEDDGIGFQDQSSNHKTSGIGDHIGLSIMRDRAQTIGAILTVDSELGEGTRITLKLPPPSLIGERTHG